MKDSVAKAALAEQTARRMTDSIIAANSAVSSAADLAPRRLVITEPADVRGWPEAGLLGRAVADSLRRMLRARGQQYTLVDPDTVRAALGRTREVNELVRTLNADLLVTIRLIQFPHDSGLIQLQAYDPGAVPVFRQRVASGKPVPKNQVLTNLDVLLLSTVTSLDDMRHAPRRQIPGAPPPPASH